MIFVWVTIFVVLGLLKALPELAAFLIGLPVLAAFSYPILLRVIELMPMFIGRTKQKIADLAKSITELNKLSEDAELFYALGITLISISFAFVYLGKFSTVITILQNLGLTSLVLAAAFDLSTRVTKLLKKAWAKLLGKLAFAAATAILVSISAALAKQQVFELTSVNPQNFQELVNILTALGTPILLLGLVCVLLAMYALLELLLCTIWLLITKTTQVPNQYNWREIFGLMRPISLLILVTLLMTPLGEGNKQIQMLESAISKRLLVILYFHSNRVCSNLNISELIAEIDNSQRVLVLKNNKQYDFAIQPCNNQLQ